MFPELKISMHLLQKRINVQHFFDNNEFFNNEKIAGNSIFKS